MGKGKSPKVNETQGFLTQQNDRELYPCPRIILHDTALKKKVSTSRCPTYNIISDPQSSVLDVAPRLGLRNVLPLLLLLLFLSSSVPFPSSSEVVREMSQLRM